MQENAARRSLHSPPFLHGSARQSSISGITINQAVNILLFLLPNILNSVTIAECFKRTDRRYLSHNFFLSNLPDNCNGSLPPSPYNFQARKGYLSIHLNLEIKKYKIRSFERNNANKNLKQSYSQNIDVIYWGVAQYKNYVHLRKKPKKIALQDLRTVFTLSSIEASHAVAPVDVYALGTCGSVFTRVAATFINI